MAAMTMPYPVRDVRGLSNLAAGDEITADVVVASDGAHLENIVVTKKGGATQEPPRN
jgi:Cu/Ag efflux protein CusF